MLINNSNKNIFYKVIDNHQEYLNLLSNHRQEVRDHVLIKANNLIDIHVEKLKDIQSKIDSGNDLNELNRAHLQAVIDGYLHQKQMINHYHKGKSKFSDHLKRIAAGVAAIIGLSSVANAQGPSDSLELSGDGSNSANQVQSNIVRYVQTEKELSECSGSLKELPAILGKIQAQPNSLSLVNSVKKLISRLTGVSFDSQNSQQILNFLNETKPQAFQSLEHAERLVFAHRLIQELLVSYSKWSEYHSNEALQYALTDTYLNALSGVLSFNEARLDKELANDSLRKDDLGTLATAHRNILEVATQHQNAYAEVIENNDGLVIQAYQMVKSQLKNQLDPLMKRMLLERLGEVTNRLDYGSSIKYAVNEFIKSEFKLLETDGATRSVGQELGMLHGRINVLINEPLTLKRNNELLDVARHLRELSEKSASSEDDSLKMTFIRMLMQILESLPSNIPEFMPLLNSIIGDIILTHKQLRNSLQFQKNFELISYYTKAVQMTPPLSKPLHRMKWAKKEALNELKRMINYSEAAKERARNY